MANGDRLKCEEFIKKVKINVQGVRRMIGIHVLNLMEHDVVLRSAWLWSFKRITSDYDKMTMEF